MTIEQCLKTYICLKYKSLRNFVNTSGIDMPYSTLDGILKRGIGKSSIENVFKLCDALGISADALCNGDIVPKQSMELKEYTDYDYIFEFMTIDGNPLTEYEQSNMKKAFHDGAETVRLGRKLFAPDYDLIYRKDGVSALINLNTRQYRTVSRENGERFIEYWKTFNDHTMLDDFLNGKIDEDGNKKE